MPDRHQGPTSPGPSSAPLVPVRSSHTGEMLPLDTARASVCGRPCCALGRRPRHPDQTGRRRLEARRVWHLLPDSSGCRAIQPVAVRWAMRVNRSVEYVRDTYGGVASVKRPLDWTSTTSSPASVATAASSSRSNP